MQLYSCSAIVMLALSLPGFLLGSIIMGLFHVYDRLPRKAALTLKFLSLVPPLVLSLIGLAVSFKFFPVTVFIYVFSGLSAWFGRAFIYGQSESLFRDRLIGIGLLVTSALPFALIALHAFSSVLGGGWYSFYIHNHGAHEIVMKEIQVDRQVIWLTGR